MRSFSHFCPTNVIFGEGQIKNVVKYLPRGCKKALLISSKTAAMKSGAHDSIKASLASENIQFLYQNTISPNPKITEVDQLVNYCKANDVDAILAAGGGSVIDAAKAVSLCYGGGLTARELLKNDLSEIVPTYLVSIPTTAGTGSEVSKGAIVTDVENTWKGGVRGDNVFPRVAILDPLLTTSMPKSITLETGFDVVTHAFESLISKAATPITRMYSQQAIQIAIPALVSVARDQITNQVRNDLLYASLLAGYNLANASTCLPHRLQYPLGANTDSAHARGLAALYPAWFRSTYKYAEADFIFICNIINSAIEKTMIVDSSAKAVESITEFLKLIEMNHSLKDFGVKEEDCELYTSQVDGNLALDPGCTKLETINQIYRESW
jgi:alcohol dehydrogenase class IV